MTSTITATAAAAAAGGAFDPNMSPDAILAGFVRAFNSHDWALLAAMTLMGVVWLMRYLKFSAMWDKQAQKWFAVGTSMAVAVAAGLIAHKPWLAIVSTGLMVGLAAIGGWETLGQMLRAVIRKVRGLPADGSGG